MDIKALTTKDEFDDWHIVARAAQLVAERADLPFAAYEAAHAIEKPRYLPDELLYGQSKRAASPWLLIGGGVLFVIYGSGGVLTGLEPSKLTGGRMFFRQPELFVRTERKALSAQDGIRALKSVFGLTLSDLAAIMLVGRPAIYEWLAGVQPRKKSLERLWQLHGAAQAWSQLTRAPLGTSIHAPFTDGHTLFALLTAAELSVDDIDRDLRALAHMSSQTTLKERKPSISASLREAGFKRPSAESRAANKELLVPTWVDDE